MRTVAITLQFGPLADLLYKALCDTNMRSTVQTPHTCIIFYAVILGCSTKRFGFHSYVFLDVLYLRSLKCVLYTITICE